jgi:hypothetical protein
VVFKTPIVTSPRLLHEMATNPSINPEKICIGKIVDARNLNKMQQRKAFAL